MKDLGQMRWLTGSHKPITIEEIIKIIKNHTSLGGKIFLGSDSFVAKRKVIFANALCLHGGELPSRYFFCREKEPSKNYKNLTARITAEASRVIVLAEKLTSKYNIKVEDLELHLDASPPSGDGGTSKISDMLKGYVLGCGFSCKLKPEAWAAQSVADRHSK